MHIYIYMYICIYIYMYMCIYIYAFTIDFFFQSKLTNLTVCGKSTWDIEGG